MNRQHSQGFRCRRSGIGRQGGRLRCIAAAVIALAAMAPATTWSAESGALRVHNIFGSNMVIQRDKPITIWGWAEPGRKVSVQFGEAKAETTAEAGKGRWEVTFPAQPADATGRKLEEAKRAVEILERLKTLGKQDSKTN